MKIDINNIIAISKQASQAILEVYNSTDFNIEQKDDKSPLTMADKKSHEIIFQGLQDLYPEIPIISEEGKDIPYEERKKWDTFLLVDPLDGTKEFIKRNDEFTVNIALIENNKPVLGVIHVPVSNETYYGSTENGAFKIDSDGEVNKISVSSKSFDEEINVVQSRSHSGEEENEFYSNYKISERLSKGSSLKICLVAEGKAELYFRGGPTWEWDTAAGHAILNAAGGIFLNKDKSELLYNKTILKNFGFIASSTKFI
ncbi:3'(2'),5'-bisphosphate nucleotidase [hydrocarbon metagenome]|uniref:3'(2'),5'-bisphosphate nucleotidase n=1 Tax=hydrocarbon metagenome TaxID=938273 RepID=A0A0W8FVB8_9ZZZZ